MLFISRKVKSSISESWFFSRYSSFSVWWSPESMHWFSFVNALPCAFNLLRRFNGRNTSSSMVEILFNLISSESNWERPSNIPRRSTRILFIMRYNELRCVFSAKVSGSRFSILLLERLISTTFFRGWSDRRSIDFSWLLRKMSDVRDFNPLNESLWVVSNLLPVISSCRRCTKGVNTSARSALIPFC